MTRSPQNSHVTNRQHLDFAECRPVSSFLSTSLGMIISPQTAQKIWLQDRQETQAKASAMVPRHSRQVRISGSGGTPRQHNLRDSALIDGSVGSHDFFGRQFRLFTDSRCFRS